VIDNGDGTQSGPVTEPNRKLPDTPVDANLTSAKSNDTTGGKPDATRPT
jgi:hypothetical protein